MHSTHSSGIRTYILVFVGLAVLTAVEVGLVASGALRDLGASAVLVLLALAAVKAALVAMFFMHLRSDTKWFSVIFIFPMLLASLLIFWLMFAAI